MGAVVLASTTSPAMSPQHLQEAKQQQEVCANPSQQAAPPRARVCVTCDVPPSAGSLCPREAHLTPRSLFGATCRQQARRDTLTGRHPRGWTLDRTR
eukprot:166357-Prorocentrum_minimum.AAC.3